jgi:hypothetical protein
MTKKRIAWVLLAAFLVGWGYQNYKHDKEEALNQARVSERWSKEIQIQGDKDLESLSHGWYQFYICNFDKNVEPVSRMLFDIAKKSSIPPDLIPVVKDFNEAVAFLSAKESIFLGKEGVLTDEELKLNTDIVVFAKEINLKTVELEQGIISGTNSYFKDLGKKVKDLVKPACNLYAATHPEESNSPSPAPGATQYQAPERFDSKMDKIGKQVSYDGICKLDASAARLLTDIENAQTSVAFKPALLESSKTSISDLGYAAFSFDGTGLYTPTPDEMHWTPEINVLKSELEKYRYSYWSSSSKQELNFMKITASKIKELGMSGCVELKRLKKS